MRNPQKKRLSSVLAILLAVCIFTGSVPLPTYAQQTEEATQVSEPTPSESGKTNDSEPSESEKPSDSTKGETGEVTKPTDGATKPADETTKPTDETTKPTDETTKPTDETTKPTDETTKPTDETTKPTDETTKPTDETTKPTDETTKPTDETSDPTDETTKPTDEATDGTEQETEPTDEETEPADGETEPEESSDPAEDAKETAITVTPKQLTLDGTKSYILFTPCVCGMYVYSIGSDASAVERPEIWPEDCAAGSTIYLAQEGLGWTLSQTDDGLVIQRGGHYLTVSEDQERLVTTQTETVSGLAIQEDGKLSLVAEGIDKTVSLQCPDDPDQQPGGIFRLTEESETVFCFAEIQEKEDGTDTAEQPTEPTDGTPAETEEPTDPTEPTYSEPVDEEVLMPLNEEAEETAVIVAPDQLVRDGRKAYIIFTSCLWGGHTYAIGPDALTTGRLGLNKEACVPENYLYLTQAGLGWTLTQTDSGLVIANNGRYLTLSEDGASLAVSETETVSGLAIDGSGKLSLAADPTKTVYLHITNHEKEPEAGQQFFVTAESNGTVFYFAEVQVPEPPEPEILFPVLLPQGNFRAEIVAPSKVYGDDQYVILTAAGDGYVAITSGAKCSSPLTLNSQPAVGVSLRSPDQNVLWTVNNNRGKSAPTGGCYKYIRSCASNMYLTPNDSLLDANIGCDFYLADRGDGSAFLVTADGHYVTVDGDRFGLTADSAAASAFYFAKLLQSEEQNAGAKTPIPKGKLLRLVDWNSITEGKSYAIISATELNELHYALTGNGRFTRNRATNLSSNSGCPNGTVNGVYGASPCPASVGGFYYANGQNILWTASGVGGGKVAFRNNGTGLYLKPSSGAAAEQTPSISGEPAALTVELAGNASAFLHDGAGNYLGVWQYISVSVSAGAPGRCAYYLAEVVEGGLPETKLVQDGDDSTFSFGGVYSIYQGSQHLLNDDTPAESFILMEDGTGSFKPSSSEFNTNGNYTVTYCADYEHDMPLYTAPRKYKAVSLEEYDGFTPEQKAALAAIIPNCYPYITEAEFLENLKAAGGTVSGNCGVDEILAGIQAAIYTVTNPRSDGNVWGYEASDPWAHSEYEVNKPASFVSSASQARSDVNTVRDYLLSLGSAPATAAEGGNAPAGKNCFAITTQINGHTWALSYYRSYVVLMPYDPTDPMQLWCNDANGCLQLFVASFNPESAERVYLFFEGSINYSEEYAQIMYLDLKEFGNLSEYDVYYEGGNYEGLVPIEFDETVGCLKIRDDKGKLARVPKNPHVSLSIGVNPDDFAEENIRYQDGAPMRLDGPYVFKGGHVNEELKVNGENVNPCFVDYKVEDTNWTVTDNKNDTYNVKVDGTLNFPLRPNFDNVHVSLWCNGTMIKKSSIAPGKQKFEIVAENISDAEEAHFCLKIEQYFMDVSVFTPPEDSGGQVQVGGIYKRIVQELHEQTASIPVKKIWDDNKNHSGDTAELRLLENDEETPYKVTLPEDGKWESAFKHVPYERWICINYNNSETIKIPQAYHEYTVKEVNVKPGYTPVYGVESDNSETLKPGKAYPVQAVCDDGSGKLVALDFSGGTLFTPYNENNAHQVLFLNDEKVLIAKNEEYGGYIRFNLEEAAEEGKYYLSIKEGDGSGYVSVKAQYGVTDQKSDATPFELYEFKKGSKLASLPTDAFHPVTTAFIAKDGEQVTDLAFEYNASSYPGVSLNTYDSGNANQKFTAYYYNDQFVVFSDSTGSEGFFQLIPNNGANDYILAALKRDRNGNEILIYFSKDENGELTETDDRSAALRFALPSGTVAAPGNVTFDGAYTVTNVPSASLEVSKTVSGKGADQNKPFTFTVTLGSKAVNGTFGDMVFKNGVATFTLKHSEKKTANGLPKDITYQVVETDNAGYTVTVNGKSAADAKASGTLVGAETVKLAFNNDKPEEPTKPTEPKPTEPKPTEPKPTRPGRPGKPSMIPKLGDPANIGLWLGILFVSAAGIIVMILIRRKKNGKKSK